MQPAQSTHGVLGGYKNNLFIVAFGKGEFIFYNSRT